MSKDNKVQKNGYIYFLKFVFSIMILIFHGRIFANNTNEILCLYAYVGVNYYFIVSGFLFINSVIKSDKFEGNSYYGALKFLGYKMKPFVLKLLIVFISAHILLNYKDILNIRLLFSDSYVAELFQISSVGYKYLLNASWWYLSVMFIIVFLLYPAVKKHKINFAYYYSPILIFISLGIVKYNHIDINSHSAISSFLMNGFYTGIIYINLGIISYAISKTIREVINDKTITKIGITILETLGYAFVIINSCIKYSGDIMIAIVLTISVALSFSNKSYTFEVFKSKIWQKLANFGFVVYLTQIGVRGFFQRYNIFVGEPYLNRLLLYALVTCIYAIIVIVIEKLLVYIYRKLLSDKLKNTFLK